MAISTSNVGAGPVTVYISAGESAVTFMSFCNHSASTVQLDIHLVPDGDVPTNDNLLAYQLNIDAGDTYIFYKGSEKILMSNNDTISVTASSANAIAAITSYTGF